MYYRLDSDEFKMLQQVEEKTCTDYDIMGNFIPVESLVSAVENLLLELKNLEESYDDLQKDLEENYKPIPVDLGISDRDFY